MNRVYGNYLGYVFAIGLTVFCCVYAYTQIHRRQVHNDLLAYTQTELADILRGASERVDSDLRSAALASTPFSLPGDPLAAQDVIMPVGLYLLDKSDAHLASLRQDVFLSNLNDVLGADSGPVRLEDGSLLFVGRRPVGPDGMQLMAVTMLTEEAMGSVLTQSAWFAGVISLAGIFVIIAISLLLHNSRQQSKYQPMVPTLVSQPYARRTAKEISVTQVWAAEPQGTHPKLPIAQYDDDEKTDESIAA